MQYLEEEAAMKYPDELRYSREHTWARVEGNLCYVGITSYAQDQLGEIVYVDLPAVGDAVEQMDTFGVVESVKAVNDLIAPVSGGVSEVNKALEDEPEIINSDPYGDGWIIAIEVTNKGDLDELLTAKEYKEMVEEEEG
jgi:glycine cleavage system H protein